MMYTSESVDKLSEALALAQGEIETVAFNKVNPHFKSKYADLSAVREACKIPLAKHGLALLQMPSMSEGRAVLISRLMHKSGQWIESQLSLRLDKDTAQGMGSAITYARRYAIISMLGMVADEDDDGNEAESKQPKPELFKKEKHRNNENIKRALEGLDSDEDKNSFIALMEGKPMTVEYMREVYSSIKKAKKDTH